MINKPKFHGGVFLNFWRELSEVTQLTFHATTKNGEGQGWNRRGNGEVSVTKEDDQCLLFHEKGHWQDSAGTEINFRNVYRWTLDPHAGVISLEHLRRGANHPVFLLHLVPINNQTFSSVNPHLCGSDTYFGQVHFDQHGLRLKWRVIGPKKNEELETLYT